MKNKLSPVSFCVGVYNEETVLLHNLQRLDSGLERVLGKSNYEIIVVDNGSTDRTPKLLRGLTSPRIHVAFLPEKGLGLALRKGLVLANYNHVVFSAIDLPFGFADLETALQYWEDYDIIFGSKAHPDSVIFVPLKRRILSSVYRSLLQVLFHTSVRDTQGSVFLNKQKVLPFLTDCDSETAFFTAQIAIYSQLYGLRVKEIPVEMKQEKSRPSKLNVLTDGVEMFSELLQEYGVYKKRISGKTP